MQFVPHVGAAPRRPQSGYPQRGTVTRCQSGEFVELVDVVPGDDDRDLGVFEAGGGEVLQRSDGHRERAFAAHGVVDLGGRAVERDLHIDVVTGGQPGRHLGRDRASGCSLSELTTSTMVRFFRNDSLRVPK